MKAWKKASPELVAAFDKAVPASPSVTRRPMFGYASAFVNGNLFAGTFQDTIMVRLSEADRVALLKVKGASPFKPMGRAMYEYVVVPASMVDKPSELGAWLARGHRYALTLPPKAAKKNTTGTKKATAKNTVTPKKTTAKKTTKRKR